MNEGEQRRALLQRQAEHYFMEIHEVTAELENRSKRTLSVFRASVPWVIIAGVVIVAFLAHQQCKKT